MDIYVLLNTDKFDIILVRGDSMRENEIEMDENSRENHNTSLEKNNKGLLIELVASLTVVLIVMFLLMLS